MPAGADDTTPAPVPVFVTLSAKLCSVNVAVTLRAAVIDTVHAPRPVQSPDQPVNDEPASGDAVSVTVAPWANVSLQMKPQAIPAGDDETEPLPVPAFATDSALNATENVAVTLFAASIVNVHEPVPEHAPLQPANVELASGVAVSVTTSPSSNAATHAAPQ